LSQLTLEITETAIMADPARAKAVLSELHDAGICLSMDDFGIGQSSLTYLKDLPISRMKIDKSFLMDFDQPRNVAIVRSAIDLARNMELQVTAEGVEHEATYLALCDLGCDVAQGYFFSKPLPVEQLRAWLAESRWGHSGHD
jgi:EAL domain-containing protein (putative c-di-GMP-specific phosphodiesterase class I)